jgi:hypothetical protein
MREPEYEMSSAIKTTRPESPMGIVQRDLEEAVSMAEKRWEMVAMRLTPWLGQTEPSDVPPSERLQAMPAGTSNAVTQLRQLVGRLEDFGERITRVEQRLEL